MDKYEKRRACILVKAYPQPSQQYEETVCVAAVTEDHQLLRLYPIRFRHLAEKQRFSRFDWIEAEMTRATDDSRPESFRIKEDTLQILMPGKKVALEDRVRLWKPCIAPSLTALLSEQETAQRSLGIIRPDVGSVRFKFEQLDHANEEDQDTARSVYKQQSLIEASLDPLPKPEYVFRYQFTSAGTQHVMKLHDWEVEATYHKYKRRYGSPERALKKMLEFYEQLAVAKNLHLIMGNMHKRPYQFIVIGVLRTTADVDHADAQQQLL